MAEQISQIKAAGIDSVQLGAKVIYMFGAELENVF